MSRKRLKRLRKNKLEKDDKLSSSKVVEETKKEEVQTEQ